MTTNERILPPNYQSPKLPDLTEGLETPEDLKLLLEESRSDIAQIVELPGEELSQGKSGQVGKVHYVVERKLGKQQPVRLLLFTFPNGKRGEVVMRPTGKNFANYQEKYQSVRESFPQLFLSLSRSDGEQILFLEKLRGLEQNTDANAWMDFAGHPENFKAINQDFFQITDKIFQEPLTLMDVQPQEGHNVFLNTRTGKVQLFDVDTLHPSDESHEWKFITFVNGMLGNTNFESQSDFKLAFQFELLRQYFEKYPNATFEKTEEPRMLRKLDYFDPGETIPNPEDYIQILKPTDDQYNEIFDMFTYLGHGARTWKIFNQGKPLPILAQVERMSQKKHRLRSEIRSAVENHDFIAFKRALQKNIKIIEEVEEKVAPELNTNSI